MERKAKLSRNNTTGYVGVTRDRAKGKYRAQIKNGNTTHFLGYFLLAGDAAKAYDEEARRKWGDKARVNFPRETR